MAVRKVLNQPIGAKFVLNNQTYMRTDLCRYNLVGCVDLDTGYVCYIPEDTLVNNYAVCNREA